jgi:DNA polymerase (family 10)
MRLEPGGLRKGRSLMAAKKDIYRVIGLRFIDPELREGRSEIERAMKGKVPKPPTT